MRLTLTNEFGPGPLDIGGVHVGLNSGGGAIVAGSDRTVTFGAGEAVRIPAGAVAVSDPVKPDTLNAAYDSGDHLRPNDAGYKAMADAIDLALFR